ncbi:DUF6635 family protein [Pararhodospirillum oryzae]|uniref:Uncharacterized protein n=1 Tax=Pararhodospirillum oryzae TaxID=478448 RepID=A0A512H4X9_9PROT|nr:DUF6635 family protein [Pararhodospirillum oryzae]GEO80503.1 hypothetical protein ROR02_06340 [Pararhodospirillum oryzae]
MVDVSASAPPVPALDRAAGRWLVEAAARRYLSARRMRVRPFVDATFTFGASLDLHRAALGWDIARAPLNAVLAVPQVAVMGSAWALGQGGRLWAPAGRAGRWLGRVTLIVPTDVGRDLTFRLFRDFLELPYDDGPGRRATRDALAEEILADPALRAWIAAALAPVVARGDDPAFRARLDRTLASYVGSRAAAAELLNAFLCLGAGLATTHAVTPGTWGLSGALAGLITQKLAVATFPLGSGAGAAWHALVPAAVPGAVLAASAASVMGAAAVVGAFAGVITDPVQRRLGWHQRRLHRVVDALESDLLGPASRPLGLRDHYVARVFDLVDLLLAAHRLSLGR